MSCFHPNILAYAEDSIIKKDGQLGTYTRVIYANSHDFKGYEFYLKRNKEIQEREGSEKYGYKMIPCGKCQGCRTAERKAWATRIELECKNYKNNYFITLTYNDENLVIPEEIKTEKRTYENEYDEWKGTLVKKDVQQFIKSLRTYFKREFNHDGMKFYLCGEYGEKGERPHYHAILMNCPEIELTPIGTNIKKHCYYTNERIEKIWGKGFINIGKVTWESISYVAGYVNKKLFGELKEEIHASKGQIPIFANMSRRPGIARQYYEEHKDEIYKNDEIINSKGQSIKPPPYFDRLLDIGEHDVMKQIKKAREEIAENNLKNKMSRTTKTIKEQLEIEERTAIQKQKRYNRERIKQ